MNSGERCLWGAEGEAGVKSDNISRTFGTGTKAIMQERMGVEEWDVKITCHVGADFWPLLGKITGSTGSINLPRVFTLQVWDIIPGILHTYTGCVVSRAKLYASAGEGIQAELFIIVASNKAVMEYRAMDEHDKDWSKPNTPTGPPVIFRGGKGVSKGRTVSFSEFEATIVWPRDGPYNTVVTAPGVGIIDGARLSFDDTADQARRSGP